MEVRKTKQRFRVLEILAEQKVSHGFEIATRAQLQVGTVYGILMAFDDGGFVESRWDDSEPDGRPRRKLYRLTQQGLDLLSEYQDHFGPDESVGFLGAVNRELHAAIDQVWGGMWQYSLRVERERQNGANESARKNRNTKPTSA